LALETKPAPNFTLNDLAGKPVSLADQKGKVVVLDFWATWCGPCVESMPHLDELNKQMSARGVRIFAVNLRETKQQVEKFLSDQKLGLPVLFDTDGKVGDLFKVQGIPQTVVIGKDGVVRKVMVGYGPGAEGQLKEVVEAALK
jgi:peroxiredoxin